MPPKGHINLIRTCGFDAILNELINPREKKESIRKTRRTKIKKKGKKKGEANKKALTKDSMGKEMGKERREGRGGWKEKEWENTIESRKHKKIKLGGRTCSSRRQRSNTLTGAQVSTYRGSTRQVPA